MNRREFLALTAAVSLALPLRAHAATKTYSPELLEAELAAGKVVFLDFKAEWCSTCKAQERAITALRKANPAYDKAISFINVDWDEWGEGDLVKALNVPRRSTLVVLKGKTEIGRLVADTSKDSIRALMDQALAKA